jgi:uncharacterized protein
LIIGTIHASAFVQTTVSIDACRDGDDNRVLELAVTGNAAAIITGDNDLLTLTPFRGVAILSPRDFLLAQDC